MTSSIAAVLRAQRIQHAGNVGRLVAAGDDDGDPNVDAGKLTGIGARACGASAIHRPPSRSTVPAVRSRMRRSNSIDRCFK